MSRAVTAQHFIYTGTNFRIAPIDNVVEIEKQIDPVYPGISRYHIEPTFAWKLGYGYGIQFLRKMSLNAGLEINHRKYSFEYTYDSIPSGNPYYILSKSRTKYYNLEIPISITMQLKKLRISGGVNIIALDLRHSRTYTELEGLVSKRLYFGYFTKLESEHFVYPFIKLDYKVLSTPRTSLYASSALEMREHHGRVVSLLLIAEFKNRSCSRTKH